MSIAFFTCSKDISPSQLAHIALPGKKSFSDTLLRKNLPVDDGIGGSFGSHLPQRALISAAHFKNILEAIRNELLQWTTELEKRGIKGEGMDFNEKEKQSATHQTFNIQKFTGVLGNVQNSQIALYDYSSVQQLLIDHNIPKAERRELEDILDELKTAPPDKKPSLIERGEKWVVKHKDFLAAAADVILKVIKGTTTGDSH